MAQQLTKTKVIIFLGPPGAGKGSQALLVKEKLQLPHISTGDLLRSNIKLGTDLGVKAKTFMEKGALVPDDLIFAMLFERVAHADCSKGYILDGFPRNLDQAKELEKRLKNSEILAINLNVPDHFLVDRITKREICTECQAPHHPDSSPAKVAGKCNQCGGELYQRSDDRKDVVEERLKIYHEKTAPLIQFYQDQESLQRIDSTLSIEAVLLEILKILS